jgi:hypothetical protein
LYELDCVDMAYAFRKRETGDSKAPVGRADSKAPEGCMNSIKCFRYGKKDHISRNCPLVQGQEEESR